MGNGLPSAIKHLEFPRNCLAYPSLSSSLLSIAKGSTSNLHPAMLPLKEADVSKLQFAVSQGHDKLHLYTACTCMNAWLQKPPQIAHVR